MRLEKTMWRLLVLVLAATWVGNAVAQDFKYVEIRIDHSVDALNLPNLVRDDKAVPPDLTSYGIHSRVATAGIEVAAGLSRSVDGEDHTTGIRAPSGYGLCSAWTGVERVRGGARYTFIWDRAGNVAIRLKTPQQLAGARIRIDATAKILWARTDLLPEFRQNALCYSGDVRAPSEQYECGDTGGCREFHIGGAFPVISPNAFQRR